MTNLSNVTPNMTGVRFCKEDDVFHVCAYDREMYWDLNPIALQHHLLPSIWRNGERGGKAENILDVLLENEILEVVKLL